MQDGNMFIERRVYPRFPVSFPVKYQVLEDKEAINAIMEESKKQVVALVRDISLGGMKVSSEEPHKLGEVLVFEIPLPAPAQPILACAEVVWADGNTSGLHFLQISDEDLEALKSYLKKLGFRS
ncbi:MAG TPA: PilZ domain-containing protein [bacterium]|nr:PilZ domain-containing protein [bacterium]